MIEIACIADFIAGLVPTARGGTENCEQHVSDDGFQSAMVAGVLQRLWLRTALVRARARVRACASA